MSTEPSAQMLFCTTLPEIEREYSQPSTETEVESSDTLKDAPTLSVKERIESYILPLKLRIQLSKMSQEEWREMFTSPPDLHAAILALRSPIPDSYQAHCPSGVDMLTEKEIFMNWAGLFCAIPNPLPEGEETDRLRNYHGHFISNNQQLSLCSDNIERVEDGGVLNFENEDGETSPLPDTLTKEEFIKFCVRRAENTLEEMAGLLPNIYDATQKVQDLADKEAYREYQREVAAKAEEPDYRDHLHIHPSILNLEYSIPSSYQPHFTQEHSAQGIIDHFIHFVGNTPEPHGYEHASRVLWRNYKACEAEIRAEKNRLFTISDTIDKLEDARFWLYGDSDWTPPPPKDRKEELITDCLEATKSVLTAIIAAFPRIREAAQCVHRAYQVEQNQPLFRRAPTRYVPPAISEYERRRREGLERQRRSRDAEFREEEENESPYLVMLGLRQRYVDWHAGWGPHPGLALLDPPRVEQARTRTRTRTRTRQRRETQGSVLEALQELRRTSNLLYRALDRNRQAAVLHSLPDDEFDLQ
ncbi:hypothetical protein BLS_009807 [Venturia inaequalis]|uniref:Uncharacterized protein n=1 Tax=Venturia inaequalis TaxID=5025 RepID=A0A8H3U4N6_VENIN|nr:hypothetical protein BLS_009807 [Venturia inaequalis]RDI80581.1 hypothetical protein Vi05172_g9461 [Venturia inaequalis]